MREKYSGRCAAAERGCPCHDMSMRDYRSKRLLRRIMTSLRKSLFPRFQRGSLCDPHLLCLSRDDDPLPPYVSSRCRKLPHQSSVHRRSDNTSRWEGANRHNTRLGSRSLGRSAQARRREGWSSLGNKARGGGQLLARSPAFRPQGGTKTSTDARPHKEASVRWRV